MRTIFVLFDTLNRHFLECYGGDLMATPNFRRLAERTMTFDNHYVGSMPCMPARRDLQTGRLNFMHRSWGPMEPFDISLPVELRKQGVYSHIITDHVHYLEDGGAGYCGRFNSFEYVRGQEGDRWKGVVEGPVEDWKERYHKNQFQGGAWDKVNAGKKSWGKRYHDMVNRDYIETEEDYSSAQCFELGCQFLDRNKDADDWFLQIETFDPHEPFAAPERLRDEYSADPNGKIRDWPPYERVTEDDQESDEMRANYKALLAFCDEHLGKLLDKMDELDMWKDTMLVVSTDHGYLLGEHDWWAKLRMPIYQEIAHIPLFIHHPDHIEKAGERRGGLTQTADLMPTFLEAYGCSINSSIRAKSILPMIENSNYKNHEAVLFGYFGGSVNITDGNHTYFRYPEDMENQELNQYTLMPSHLTGHFSAAELKGAELIHDFSFANGLPVMRIPIVPDSPWYKTHGPARMMNNPSVMFDIKADPLQQTPLGDEVLLSKFEKLLENTMKYHDAPAEAFTRLNLTSL